VERKKPIAVEKRAIAVGIALQTHVLKTCAQHNAVFCDDEVDPASAFALAIDLVNQHTPYVDEFEGDAHELTDLLSAIIGDAPDCCPACAGATRDPSGEQVLRAGTSGASERSGLCQGLLQGWHVVRLGQQEQARPFRAEDELHV
jgi:hypothetical protein